MKEAMANLYSLLRDSENTEGAEFVIISSLDGFDEMCGDCDRLPDFLDTVYDKTFRASSGRLLNFSEEDQNCQLTNLSKTEK